MKRLVIVSDNRLIVEATRIGLRDEFDVVRRANTTTTSDQTILEAQPDVIMLDDVERSDQALELTRAIRSADKNVTIILLTLQGDPDWISAAFSAGTSVLISKAARPAALVTLVRESVNGHIVHRYDPLATDGMRPSCRPEHLPLTEREFEILRLVASGWRNGDVARKLWVSEQTVKFHLRNIYRKLGVANRTQASHCAHVQGLVDMREEAASRSEPAFAVAS